MISRPQLMTLDLSPTQVKANMAAGRWRRMHPGVYVTFTGSVDALGRAWAAVLYAGSGSAIGGRAALWLWSVTADMPHVITVAVPEARRVRDQPGLRVERRRGLNVRGPRSPVHPSAQPPRLRLEHALLDVTQSSSPSEAVDVVLRAAQRRLTTAALLRLCIDQRVRLRWRRLLLDALADIDEGVTSPLEARYRHEVERRHRLPAGVRNQPELQPGGGYRYRDVQYRDWRVLVELDGQEAHPRAEAFRDLRRDNASTVAGDVTLRYGWRDVVGDPCAVAAQVAAVLRLNGWTGRARPCSVSCATRAQA